MNEDSAARESTVIENDESSDTPQAAAAAAAAAEESSSLIPEIARLSMFRNDEPSGDENVCLDEEREPGGGESGDGGFLLQPNSTEPREAENPPNALSLGRCPVARWILSYAISSHETRHRR